MKRLERQPLRRCGHILIGLAIFLIVMIFITNFSVANGGMEELVFIFTCALMIGAIVLLINAVILLWISTKTE